jgi:hypothetical protein
MDPARHPFTLLCETCGYNVEGLPASSACPECSRPIARSLPEARCGSPWQRRRGLWSLVTTDYQLIRRPDRIFEQLRLDWPSGAWLLAIHAVAAATVLAAPWNGVLVGDPVRTARTEGLGQKALAAATSIPIQVGAVAAVLILLTLVEWAGIQFFAQRRGWRLTPLAAWQVCAHASVGWVVMAITSWLGLIAWLNISYFGLSGLFSGRGGSSDALLLFVPAAGAFLGLLVFEILVYTGVRRCRFANRQRGVVAVEHPNMTPDLPTIAQ